MKKLLVLLPALLASLAQADTLVLWTFNSAENDISPATGTNAPFVGSGTAASIGTVTNSYGTVASGGSSDDTSPLDNTQLRLGNFPAQGTANKTSGMEFRFSTAGYENIAVVWDHYNSATASRYWRVQYTLDGTAWLDHVVVSNTVVTTWINQTLGASFAGIPAANNNPNFGVRVVSEFVSTATGTGADTYAAVGTGNYGPAGTWWLDMFRVTGDVQTANQAPHISAIASVTTRVDVATAPLPFTVGDAETPAANLAVSATSSDYALAWQFDFSGSGSNRTVVVTPTPTLTGVADITVRVTDEGGKFSESTFRVTVLPANTPPTITTFPSQILPVDGATTNIAFTVGDLETAPGDLAVSVYTPNTTLLPPAGVQFGGSGAARTVMLTPAANEAGATWVSVVVSDGELSATNSFMLKVLRPQTVVLWNFNSVPPDNNTSTGTLDPAVGTGAATSVGSATNSLNSNVAAASFDPATTDNSKWRFGNFPAQGTDNKTSGAEIRVSTVGYRNLAITWDHYNSATGNRYWRLQYSLDGVNFVDTSYVFTTPRETTFFPAGTSLASIAGANNNPNFALRIVSEWESTATGAGGDLYRGSQSSGSYGITGTLWLDTVTITADADEPPALAIALVGDAVQVSWPASATGFTLKAKSDLPTGAWETVTQTPVVVGDRWVVTVPPSGASRFFRLEQ
jgi:hypothetical protein